MCKYFEQKNSKKFTTKVINNFKKLSKTKSQTAYLQLFAILKKFKSCPKQKVINNLWSTFYEI